MNRHALYMRRGRLRRAATAAYLRLVAFCREAGLQWSPQSWLDSARMGRIPGRPWREIRRLEA